MLIWNLGNNGVARYLVLRVIVSPVFDTYKFCLFIVNILVVCCPLSGIKIWVSTVSTCEVPNAVNWTDMGLSGNE